MPSTFTTNLGIEKPGDGEQDGLWGDIVNENSDILDRAVNGVLSLTLTGTSSTLTTSDGILSSGQYKLLVLTGTPSGTHTITISPNDAQKIYYVRNTTAQSVIFTQGSGGNYTLLAGDSAIIYSNGAGASAAVANIADHLAMSSPNITGGTISGITDLAIADGGTGASSAASALTNFGLTATAAEINTLDNINTAGNFGLVPSGGVIMWSGAVAAIPTGWLLCNGTNGTPNLIDRFVVGAGSAYAVGAMGGAATVTLNQAETPVHTHTFSGTTSGFSNDHSHTGYTGTDGAHSHGSGAGGNFLMVQAGGGPGYDTGNAYSPTYAAGVTGTAGAHSHAVQTYGASANHTHTYSGTTSSIGSGAAHENRPPYYALCYIMKS